MFFFKGKKKCTSCNLKINKLCFNKDKYNDIYYIIERNNIFCYRCFQIINYKNYHLYNNSKEWINDVLYYFKDKKNLEFIVTNIGISSIPDVELDMRYYHNKLFFNGSMDENHLKWCKYLKNKSKINYYYTSNYWINLLFILFLNKINYYKHIIYNNLSYLNLNITKKNDSYIKESIFKYYYNHDNNLSYLDLSYNYDNNLSV